MLKLTKNTFVYLLLIFAISSCLSRVEKHGYMIDLVDHDLLQKGITTKDRVLRIMGSPTIISEIDEEETWIYFSEDVKKLLFFKPNPVARSIISIKFDDSQTISELENYDISQETKLAFSSYHTKVESNKDGFFKSIFSNIGQVRPQ